MNRPARRRRPRRHRLRVLLAVLIMATAVGLRVLGTYTGYVWGGRIVAPGRPGDRGPSPSWGSHLAPTDWSARRGGPNRAALAARRGRRSGGCGGGRPIHLPRRHAQQR